MLPIYARKTPATRRLTRTRPRRKRALLNLELLEDRCLLSTFTVTNTKDGGNVIEGNFIGTDSTGTIARGNGFGVIVSSSDNRIGGTSASTRNIISGNRLPNVDIFSSGGTNNLVEGNFIGTDVTGTKALG